MITVYQKFNELAEEMKRGEGSLHQNNCALNYVTKKDKFYNNPCLAWQKGVSDFAEWLDYLGIKVKISDKKDNFYEFKSSYYEEGR